MSNPAGHPDDPERAARLRDDADEAHQAALDRADRIADHAPAPDPATPRRSTVAFLDAADRGTLIWNAADSKGALARGIGVALDDLLNIAVAHIDDGTDYHDYPPAAAKVAHVADAFLLGMLIGRELPR